MPNHQERVRAANEGNFTRVPRAGYELVQSPSGYLDPSIMGAVVDEFENGDWYVQFWGILESQKILGWLRDPTKVKT